MWFMNDVAEFSNLLEGMCNVYGVATICKLLEIIGLFCKRAL